ncbi:autotransporter outer membrane beta-barrel domain-containing protein [Pseudomonas sp. HR96]|uniref:autotransporter outer membrane beta-barrel domain-containing protein n=1 Tax=Pseudomonas sp. HR96 TaxID=1027966 RepID=UPI002A74991F|nr:autotransporter outer membrane beta-barrel domain-containing protein [Pseudomonas sp. HR96]WPP01438.1 autotransporter outer membrane beta-barrel domain-containing protein [Pseudomonas sp. HR96]
MSILRPRHVPAALALAISQVLWLASHAHARDQPVLAENGARVDAHDLFIATVGNNQMAITARSGGQVDARDNDVATSGNASMGVYVHDAGSQFTSQGRLNIFSSGNNASAVMVEQQGTASIEVLQAVTTGDGSYGLHVLSGGQVDLQGGAITTYGGTSYGLMSQGGGSSISASNLSVETFGARATAVHVNDNSSTRLTDVTLATEGAQARGVYVIGRDAGFEAERLQVTTRGDGAAGVYALATDRTLSLRDFSITTQGANSHGVQIDQSHAQLEGGRIHVENGYGLWAGGRDAAGQGASIIGRDLTISGSGVAAIVGARVNLAQSSITTTRDGAAALVVSRDGQIDLDGVRVHTEGDDAPVARLAGGIINARNTYLRADNGLALHATTADNTFSLDNGELHGSVLVDDGATLDLTLNGSLLDGHVENLSSLQVLAGSQWNMDASSDVGALHLDGGLITFGNPQQFYTLTAGELTGNGIFELSLNMQERMIDFLDITGQASGDHLVRIQNSGAEPEPDFDPLHVIRTGGGDAHFGLLGARVDLGAFSYDLERSDDDWFLSNQRGGVSPSTRTVQALFNTAPSIWYGELSTLRSRMGEVRGSGQGGAWMRSYGNQYNVDTGGGLGYRQRQMGLSLGVDTVARSADSQWLVGVLGGYSHSDLSLSRGSSGQVDSYYLGAYGTWLADSGWYADALVKANQFQNQADVRMSDGARARGDYVSHGLGASLELGRHIKLGEELFVEPFTQWSGLLVGGRQFELDNGLRAQNASTGSLLGKAGATLGRTHQLAQGGIVQPYLKAALAHEFARGNGVKVNGHRFKNDLAGSRGELGAGVAVAMSSNLQLHGHVDYMGGEQIEQPWGVNVGMRYAFD